MGDGWGRDLWSSERLVTLDAVNKTGNQPLRISDLVSEMGKATVRSTNHCIPTFRGLKLELGYKKAAGGSKENFWIDRHPERKYSSIRRLVKEFVRDEKKLVVEPLKQT